MFDKRFFGDSQFLLAGPALWALNDKGNSLTRIVPATGKPTETQDVSRDSRVLYVSNRGEGNALLIDFGSQKELVGIGVRLRNSVVGRPVGSYSGHAGSHCRGSAGGGDVLLTGARILRLVPD